MTSFSRRVGSLGLLLIRVRTPTSPLVSTLAATATSSLPPSTRGAPPPRDSDLLEFRTGIFDPRGAERADSAGLVGHPEESQLQALLTEAIYVAPLQKRDDGAAFLEKITIGRTRNHDLVLRDPSVSKFHAAFQRDEDGKLLLQDMGSKNFTRLNGRKLTRAEEVSPGDQLTFGSIDAVFCSTVGLWRFFHS